ncbi:unnamed protein product [Miscanthus lutarioriparius]|uniref:Plant heme peroxidase family profile domain-containing protein n=1 Tax=Miscanthus lutarioriparius TaxID=422564 RepID=A0A811QSB7_9POAL|nr:unnamed protein product [Miscanthus lutarioriparius]
MSAPVVDAEYMAEIERAQRDLRALISSKNCAPIMLRLAWHDAGTYDAKTNTGGPNGSIRFPQEYSHSSNALAGVVAVEVTGGPTIDFVPGRKVIVLYKWQPQRTFDVFGRTSQIQLFCITEQFSILLALVICHKGRAHPERTGFDGPWTKEPLKFDNSYFVELLKGDSEGLLKLPTDKVLVEDPEFRQYVELYAKDEEAFFRDYAESHKKLSELGFTPPRSSFTCKSGNKQKSLLVQAAAGVAVAAAVVSWAYLCESNKKFI